MKQSISLETETYTAPRQVSPHFSPSLSQASLPSTLAPGTQLADIDFPLFEEATQTAARFLQVPVSFIGLITPETLVLKAAVGLSQLGLMNPLARTRRLSLRDSLIDTVLSTQRSLVLSDISEESPYAESCLVQEYGICSYIGIPLLTADGQCLGLLTVMDTVPHSFATEMIAFVELLARWSVSEYERHHLAIALSQSSPQAATSNSHTATTNDNLLDTVRLTLMSQLTQDMRNPLTTITGMASMLSREIYGTLTPKQREYADIVHTSSKYLLELANEVLELSGLDARMQPLQPTSVDVDMIGQHVERMLLPMLAEKNQELRFTVEPGSRVWTLDRDVVRYLLYHLLFSIIQLAGEGGTLQVHSAERDSSLNISIKMTHPWLGDGLPSLVADLHRKLEQPDQEIDLLTRLLARATGREDFTNSDSADAHDFEPRAEITQSRETLALLLSRHLIERHGGLLCLQGKPDTGYRFMITLPFLKMAATAK
ncbi:GAF domain-containing sensor histidine kinase [Leptolyngbya iicbica]|uniref:histidine kinase n=2 Tax=Cyanophyceae TaxID=3028117 RepID=A0A4Q7E908_9CYAN|nr:GAF domain-containing sensor histidine kinase [Leptolyngbya sp. LK]RZM79690.1 GAF domain-containing sensor histidine kinase [Leptolyngbya sp. LK]